MRYEEIRRNFPGQSIMVAIAPIPASEASRLQALYSYQVLDTPADERFDLFTRLCTWVFTVPIAAINLVDSSRTCFKSLIGFAPYHPARATSFCAHVVGIGEPVMVVEDLSADSRFHDHSLTLNGVRFYAGALLRSSCGHALGTLCVGDVRPRRFSAEDRDKLVQMAEGVGAVLDLHRKSLLLHRAANEDALTGLCNRRLFMEHLHDAVAGLAAGASCVLLCLDLDGFKQVNDTWGHAAGDALLREVGRRLCESIRGADTVARLGGDEFAILLRDAPTIPRAEEIATRVLNAFSRPFMFEGAELPISGSIGIAFGAPGLDATDATSLMRCADSALYRAKQSGRGRYRVHDPAVGALPVPVPAA